MKTTIWFHGETALIPLNKDTLEYFERLAGQRSAMPEVHIVTTYVVPVPGFGNDFSPIFVTADDCEAREVQ